MTQQKTEFDVSTLDQLKKTCDAIISVIKTPAVFFVEGDLGAGKTTFVKNFSVQYLASKKMKFQESQIHSPTYNLHNKYHVIDHFDLYRIESADEISNSGLFEFLNISDRSIVFIEWPQFAKGFSVWVDLNKYELSIQNFATKRVLNIKDITI